MSEAEKESIVEALQDQSETPEEEITKTDEIINSKPEISETSTEEEEEEGLSLKGGKRFGIGRKKSTSQEKNLDTSLEATLNVADPNNPNSLRNKLKDLKDACGGKKV